MKIIIDADGCPVTKLTVEIAKKFDISVLVVCDTAHLTQIEGAQCLTVDKGADSADFMIVNKADCSDIIVTQDYGLAAMCLSKKAVAINQNGLIYSNENIDSLLMQRHINKKIRQGGGKTAHAKKRTQQQNDKFAATLTRLLEEYINGKGN